MFTKIYNSFTMFVYRNMPEKDYTTSVFKHTSKLLGEQKVQNLFGKDLLSDCINKNLRFCRKCNDSAILYSIKHTISVKINLYLPDLSLTKIY